jgi:hypothetical protein
MEVHALYRKIRRIEFARVVAKAKSADRPLADPTFITIARAQIAGDNTRPRRK